MKTKATLLGIFILPAFLLAQSGFQSYSDLYKFSRTPPGAMKFGLYGYDNPALLTYLHDFDLYFTWSPPRGEFTNMNYWGLFTGFKNIGFGMVEQKIGSSKIDDYRISSAFGNKSISFGVQYGWSNGDRNFFNRSNIISLGTLFRPTRMLSFGFVGTSTTNLRDQEAVIDFAVRPFSNESLTLFADYVFKRNNNSKNAPWSIGAAIEPFPGVRVSARYFDTKSINIGFDLSFGNIGLSSQAHYNQEQKYVNNSYGIRLGAYDRNLLSSLIKSEDYVKLDLNGAIKYQKFQLFDHSKTLLPILNQLEVIKNDQNVKGLSINTSGIKISREMLWEIRAKLKELKDHGKEIWIYIDNANIDLYHFASIADKIIMDEIGLLQLGGYVMGRTFYKGTLEKLGIGYDEWRFFEYKSAMESFSREKMSEKDREQRKKLVDDFYELARKEIASSRNISEEDFDSIVNNEVVFMAQEALNKGLVDSLARWYVEPSTPKDAKVEKKNFVAVNSLDAFNLPVDNYWGEKPAVAVIYALGVCAMDEGISSRSLVKDIEAAAKNSQVKAVVLRVDSPGGDALASDVIAEALKKIKGKKPVIISQGSVAASGGYWLSMYGDTIVAAPNTITGSIGVIGGWFYNKKLKEEIGFSTDYVKRGEHADLGFGMRIPLLNMSIPDRNLTDLERSRVEVLLKQMYNSFLTKVSNGRSKSKEEISKIAEGRVWSGNDGLNIGLVDVIGGLETAILIAKEKAGIEGDDYQILQYPKMPLFNLSSLIPSPFPFEVQESSEIQMLKFRIKNNGYPLLMIPLDELPEDFLMVE
jgi:protease-4